MWKQFKNWLIKISIKGLVKSGASQKVQGIIDNIIKELEKKYLEDNK